MKIAYIGFGEAARAFTDSLSGKADVAFIAAYDVKQDEAMAAEARSRGLRFEPSVEAALDGADWIVAAVTADQSLEAARSALSVLRPGQLYIDINSVSPGRKRETAMLVEATGAAYLDMAVMAPVHPRGHATPVLMAGKPARALEPLLSDLGFAFETVGEEVGTATAIKMVRSLFVKGLEALTVETMLAARASGCYGRVLGSLAETFPGLGWPGNVDYMFERTLRHGLRRAAEMGEVAKTYDELGFAGRLADAIADVQQLQGEVDAKGLGPGDRAEAIAEIAAKRRALGR
jgi:3-hydroxyisobutyrate dehydrogenase-like beta-hydroxyacid dehydrogenase